MERARSARALSPNPPPPPALPRVLVRCANLCSWRALVPTRSAGGRCGALKQRKCHVAGDNFAGERGRSAKGENGRNFKGSCTLAKDRTPSAA